MVAPSETLVDGPYFEDLSRGDRLDESPGLTLTEGLAAAHRAVAAGERFRVVGGSLVHLRSRVSARRHEAPPAEVLDWRFVALFA
ncbi:MAG TPA: hypothetical protein VGG54_33930 [Trebonia sp.]